MAETKRVLSSSTEQQEDYYPDGSAAPILDHNGKTIRTLEQLQELTFRNLQYWANVFGLQGWKIHLEYLDKFPTKDDSDSFPLTMFNITMWSMKQANIFISKQETTKETDEELNKAILHEVCHIVINEMRWDTTRSPDRGHGCACEHDHEERVVCELTEAVWNLHRGMHGLMMERDSYHQQSVDYMNLVEDKQAEIALLQEKNNN